MLSNRVASERIGTLLATGSPTSVISNQELGELLNQAYGRLRPMKEVLIVPPDASRPDANAPFLLQHALKFFERHERAVVPALGTHDPMEPEEMREFFGADTPVELFQPHDAVTGTSLAGVIDASTVERLTNGLYHQEFPIHISSRINGSNRVIAFSHIVPHEVMGFAGYSKHILVGLGGAETIDKSHEIAALFGIDETLGRMDTPSRRLINYGHREFVADKNIVYVMLVRSPAADAEQAHADDHGMITRGVYVGNGDELFEQAVKLSRQVNMTVVEPLQEAVVYLPAENYHTFWLGMKGCYRMRLAMKEGGTLHVVCPGVKKFGGNDNQSRIIQQYGYQGWTKLKELYDTVPELQRHSGIWAHLTHGSPPESRPGVPAFKLMVYPKMGEGGFTPSQLRLAHLGYGNGDEIMRRFSLTEDSPVGYTNGIYFAGNPAKGLWLTREALEKLD